MAYSPFILVVKYVSVNQKIMPDSELPLQNKTMLYFKMNTEYLKPML